jgi:hypothetical protein
MGDYDREVVEMAQAIENKVEAAHRRRDLFEIATGFGVLGVRV